MLKRGVFFHPESDCLYSEFLATADYDLSWNVSLEEFFRNYETKWSQYVGGN